MNKYTFNSGDLNSNNDNIRIKVAMDPGSVSSLIVRNVNNSGIINYITESDYLYEISRTSYIEKNLRELDPSFFGNISYPSGAAFIPGLKICANATSKVLDERYRLPVGTYMHVNDAGSHVITGELLDDESNLVDVSMDGIASGNYISPSGIFESGWDVSGGLKISEIYSPNGTLPFIDVENLDTSNSQIARMDIYASELNGCFFEIELQNDITSTGIPLDDYQSNIVGDPSEISKKENEILPMNMGSESESRMIDEWNSIFKINAGCNIEEEFSNKKNRDEAFIDAIRTYLDKNWNNSMKKFLWGDAISLLEVNQNLTRKSGEALMVAIFYQLYYYGASDDIKLLSEGTNQKQRLGKSMEWHMGLGGVSKLSGKERKLKEEYTYLPTSRSYKKIYKVYDMPPRNSFSSTTESNEKMFNNMGEEFEEKPMALFGYYPLYSSESYAESLGQGFSEKFEFNNKNYYMPSGLVSGANYFHGDYDPKLLISYLNQQENFNLDSEEQSEVQSSYEQSNVYGYQETEQEDEAIQIYSTEEVEEDSLLVQRTNTSINLDLNDYAPLQNTEDPELAQEIAEQTFLINFNSYE